ncbi:DNA recombination protein RmuC [Segeticoccus rhizosphaerae]|jgi:DNA recombination protein RmuC|uniref:DNA recombination protein RmuC n=1 Tax=Segeticoccus rhizosphaerae TaxID=1104777 RepID=UPI0010C01447|nr:DNA recombination protein RmuC [Ornithinicoccus soli]
MDLILAALLGLALGVAATWLALRAWHVARSAAIAAERDLLRERVVDLEAALRDDMQTASVLAPLREALTRVERQVGSLERDRQLQFGELGARLTEVTGTTEQLRAATSSLAGSLNASTTRGTWGEVQLRRVLEHAGMLARCDFDEQVSAVSRHERGVRPDVLVHLPGDKCLVVDAKAPMTAFLAAQAEGLDPAERQRLRAAHATALRGHVTALAAKAYWTAFRTTPQMVVCFVPGDAVLAAALAADPGLFEEAMAKKVVLASPGTLLALLRTVAFTWQQDALTTSARELLALGNELYARLGSLGSHATKMGTALRRSVESYNAMVGALESRVLVTARKMHQLDLEPEPLADLLPVEDSPRPLTASELLDAVADEGCRPELDLDLELDRVTADRTRAQGRDSA